jgi:hypothetical protein
MVLPPDKMPIAVMDRVCGGRWTAFLQDGCGIDLATGRSGGAAATASPSPKSQPPTGVGGGLRKAKWAKSPSNAAWQPIVRSAASAVNTIF